MPGRLRPAIPCTIWRRVKPSGTQEEGTHEMKLSADRILTTHVGSLPRPPDLLALLDARETGREFDPSMFETRLARAVHEVVAKQVAAGIDSVCDGELGKISYTTYVRHRFSGIGAFRGGDNDKPPPVSYTHLTLPTN